MTFELVVDWYHYGQKLMLCPSCCLLLEGIGLRVRACTCFSESVFWGFRFSVKEEINYLRRLQFKPCQRGVAGERETHKMFGIPRRDTGRRIPTPVNKIKWEHKYKTSALRSGLCTNKMATRPFELLQKQHLFTNNSLILSFQMDPKYFNDVSKS